MSSGVPSLRAAEIHAALGSRWPSVLASLGIPEDALRIKRSGPCPACGGRDRFTFDNRKGRGDFICRGCGAGDGFALLERVHGWRFSEARRRVLEAAGLADGADSIAPSPPSKAFSAPEPPATPSRRVLEIRRGTCEPSAVSDVVNYLVSRSLWPLPAGCTLRAHASVEYWERRERLGRFSALVADIRDIDGELVSVHVTYLQNGAKFADHDSRKILSKLTGRTGCAARLMPLEGDTLGIAEGIETALSAGKLHAVPVWAALNKEVLKKFEPPASVRGLIVFADRDIPGLEAAGHLLERLQGRVRVELKPPAEPYKDWNDTLRVFHG